MKQPTVEIFYACDERFLKYTEVSLHSMMKNASGERNYHVHILHTGISEDSEKRVMAKATDSFKITFDDVTGELETLSDRLPLRDYYSNSTYFRLFIADMYPELDKAIYIDGDTVVNGDISELFDTDVTKYDVAACHEQAMVQEDAYGTYVEKCLGLDRNAYFNAGVLLLNCKRFRRNKMLERFSELLEIYNCRVTQDEDYLNIMFKDHVLFLPQCWNSEVFGKIEYSEEESKIIHYIMVAKPWHYADCRYAGSFWRYAEEAGVADDLRKELASYTEEQRMRDAQSCKRLMELALRGAKTRHLPCKDFGSPKHGEDCNKEQNRSLRERGTLRRGRRGRSSHKTHKRRGGRFFLQASLKQARSKGRIPRGTPLRKAACA